MDVINAIAKARFASSAPQRVVLHKSDSACVELLCMEPGQAVRVSSGQWAYYVIKGLAKALADGTDIELTLGQMAATSCDEAHSITNVGEQRLICIAVGK